MLLDHQWHCLIEDAVRVGLSLGERFRVFLSARSANTLNSTLADVFLV